MEGSFSPFPDTLLIANDNQPQTHLNHLSWNAAGQEVINQIISRRFELALAYYEFIRELEPRLPDPHIARQLVSRGYYAMFSAGRAVSLTLCGRDWGMGSGNHGNLPTHLEIHTTGDRWFPKFHQHLKDWRTLRNGADYDLFTVLVYSGRYAGCRPPRVGPDYSNLDDAAKILGDLVEEYLEESQRLITSKGVARFLAQTPRLYREYRRSHRKPIRNHPAIAAIGGGAVPF